MTSRLAQVFLLVAVSAAWGLGANALRSKPLPLTGAIGPPSTPEQGSQLAAVAPETALSSWEAGALLIDVRDPPDYLARRVSGAMSLPASDFEARYFDGLAQLAPEIPLIVYGAGADSFAVRRVADELLQRGHARVDVVVSGLDALAAAGAPLAAGAEEAP